MLEREKIIPDIAPTPSPAMNGYLNNRKIGPGLDCNSNCENNRPDQDRTTTPKMIRGEAGEA
jgi:hypothetical protein